MISNLIFLTVFEIQIKQIIIINQTIKFLQNVQQIIINRQANSKSYFSFHKQDYNFQQKQKRLRTNDQTSQNKLIINGCLQKQKKLSLQKQIKQLIDYNKIKFISYILYEVIWLGSIF
ncbi:hypothetical protein ABPG72_001492 [Tetrahymena utriculariae]